MMTFKDLIRSDVRTTFLNTLEFADLHTVNGKEMPVQIDSNEQIEREKRLNQNQDGVYKNQKLIYVSAEDFGPLPKQGSLLTLDKRDYRVEDAVDEYGVYTITLGATRA